MRSISLVTLFCGISRAFCDLVLGWLILVLVMSGEGYGVLAYICVIRKFVF